MGPVFASVVVPTLMNFLLFLVAAAYDVQAVGRDAEGEGDDMISALPYSSARLGENVSKAGIEPRVIYSPRRSETDT